MSSTNGFHIEDVESVLSGKQQVIGAQPPRRKTIASRVAKNVSRRVVANAQAEVIREVLAKFITTVYETDERGRPWNVSEYGRIEISVPWSRNGSRKWAVRRIHAEILKHSMMKGQNNRTPFIFDAIEYRWYLNVEAYPTCQAALEWLDTFNIDAAMWNLMMDAWRKSRK